MSFSIISVLFALLTFSTAFPYQDRYANVDLIRRQGTGTVTGPGLVWYDSNLTHGTKGKANPAAYICYQGPASKFPARATWINFNAMFNLQKQVALAPIGDSPSEIVAIRNGILQISQAAKVDPRVILGVIIVESTGNVRVNCTTSFGGVPNCGLMQSYNPDVKKYNPKQPQISITQMIRDGTQGTKSGPGLVQWLNGAPNTSFKSGGNIYKSLRGYNSGSLNETNLSDGRGASAEYVSNVANYLQGWNGRGNGAKFCNFPTATTTPGPTVTPTACSAAKYTPEPTQTPTGTTADCCTWYVTKSGDNCYNISQAYGISLDQFYSWNTQLMADCSNLYVNYAYCVSSDDPVSSGGARVAAPTTTSTVTVTTTRATAQPTQTTTSTPF